MDTHFIVLEYSRKCEITDLIKHPVRKRDWCTFSPQKFKRQNILFFSSYDQCEIHTRPSSKKDSGTFTWAWANIAVFNKTRYTARFSWDLIAVSKITEKVICFFFLFEMRCFLKRRFIICIYNCLKHSSF